VGEIYPTFSKQKLCEYQMCSSWAKKICMVMWYQICWFRHMNENDVSRSRFDLRDSCSTSLIGSRTCQEVETLLFSNFPWEEVVLSLHGKACDVYC